MIITEEMKKEYLRSILGNRPFQLTFPVSEEPAMAFTYRTLLLKESQKQDWYEDQVDKEGPLSGKILAKHKDMLRVLFRLKDNTHELSIALQTEPVTDQMWERIIEYTDSLSAELYWAYVNTFNQFTETISSLRDEITNPDFWKGAGPA